MGTVPAVSVPGAARTPFPSERRSELTVKVTWDLAHPASLPAPDPSSPEKLHAAGKLDTTGQWRILADTTFASAQGQQHLRPSAIRVARTP